jgi:hypothetical protein
MPTPREYTADDVTWTNRRHPLPPGVAIEAFARCYVRRYQGYETSAGQTAFWK